MHMYMSTKSNPSGDPVPLSVRNNLTQVLEIISHAAKVELCMLLWYVHGKCKTRKMLGKECGNGGGGI